MCTLPLENGIKSQNAEPSKPLGPRPIFFDVRMTISASGTLRSTRSYWIRKSFSRAQVLTEWLIAADTVVAQSTIVEFVE